MKKIKIIRYGALSVIILGIICFLAALDIRVQQVVSGKLESFSADSVVRVIVGGSQFGVFKLSYYNNLRRPLTPGDTVTIAFIQGKREIVLGCQGNRSLWRIVYVQRLNYWLLLGFFTLLLAGIVYVRYRYANSFYMNMGLWRNRHEKFGNPQLSH